MSKDEASWLEKTSTLADAVSDLRDAHAVYLSPSVSILLDLCSFAMVLVSGVQKSDHEILMTLTELKDKVEAYPKLSKETVEHIMAVQEVAMAGRRPASSDMYKSRMAALKEAVTNMLERVVAMNLDSKLVEADVEDLRSRAKTVQGLSHASLQACAWSDTPVNDRACVDFACACLCLFCEKIPSIVSRKLGDVSAHDSSNSVKTLVGQLSNRETCKLHLVWLVGEPLAEQFLDRVAALVTSWLSSATEFGNALIKTCEETSSALEALLPADVSTKPWMDIKNSANTKQLDQMRTLRGTLKATLKEVTEKKLEGVDTQKLSTLLEDAKNFTFIWGLAKFMAHPGISEATDDGATKRKNLGDIWSINKVDKPFLKFLGDARLKEVEVVLAFKDGKAATPEPNKKRKPAASASSRQTKKAKSK